MDKILHLLLFFQFFIYNTAQSQVFINQEDFFLDSSFIVRNKIKCVSIRVPALENTEGVYEVPKMQQLCFNPDGKLARYECVFPNDSLSKLFFEETHYDEFSRPIKRRKWQHCTDRDSLREEIILGYLNDGRLYSEYHYQIYQGAYNEYELSYEWVNDTFCLQHTSENRADTLRFNRLGQIIDCFKNGWRYFFVRDDAGKILQIRYGWRDANLSDERQMVGFYNFVYDTENRLERIESENRDIIFTLDYRGLPLSSFVRDRRNGVKMGWEVLYDYEIRY